MQNREQGQAHQPAEVVTSPNRYGVDVEYFRGELARLSASLDNRPPDELARYLQTLANAAKRDPTPVDAGPGSPDLGRAWNLLADAMHILDGIDLDNVYTTQGRVARLLKEAHAIVQTAISTPKGSA